MLFEPSRGGHHYKYHYTCMPCHCSHRHDCGDNLYTNNGCWQIVLQSSLFSAAEQVLGKFRDQFIRDLNADAIVYGLKDKNIIADGTVEAIRQESSQKLKNEILHDHLVRTCTERALKKVCDIIMAVQGNPKMAELGEDMKSMLAGKCT